MAFTGKRNNLFASFFFFFAYKSKRLFKKTLSLSLLLVRTRRNKKVKILPFSASGVPLKYDGHGRSQEDYHRYWSWNRYIFFSLLYSIRFMHKVSVFWIFSRFLSSLIQNLSFSFFFLEKFWRSEIDRSMSSIYVLTLLTALMKRACMCFFSSHWFLMIMCRWCNGDIRGFEITWSWCHWPHYYLWERLHRSRHS